MLHYNGLGVLPDKGRQRCFILWIAKDNITQYEYLDPLLILKVAAAMI